MWRRSLTDIQRTAPFARTAQALNLHWESAFPCCLQDADFKLIDVNPAYLNFTGYRSEALLGRDPVLMFPEADRALHLAWRQQWLERVQRSMPALLTEHRLLDSDGRERWFRASMQVLTDPRAGTAYLSVLQDSTAEHVARERADRSALELDDWFGLSPVGMVLFDESGLLVRTNPAFEALVGTAPALMSQASGALQELLAWSSAGTQGAPSTLLQVGAKPVVSRGWLPNPQGGQRRLQATVRCYLTTLGQRRFMGVVEDRSMEEERDLAQVDRKSVV